MSVGGVGPPNPRCKRLYLKEYNLLQALLLFGEFPEKIEVIQKGLERIYLLNFS